MLGPIIAWTLMGLLAMLAAAEIVRYVRAGRDGEALPYPRRRLARRLAIAIDFILAIAVVTFLPDLSPGISLGILMGVLLSVLVGFVLLLRDLHETSRAVVGHVGQVNRDFNDSLSEIDPEQKPRS